LALGRGDLATAERLARAAARTATGLEGFDPVVRGAQGQLVDVLLIKGQAEEALEAAADGLDHRISRLGTDNELVGEGWVLVARARWATGDRDGARAALDESFRLGWSLDQVTEPDELAALAREIEVD
jgi:hypothetical protein